MIPVIKSSVRGVLGKYSSEELYLKTKDELSLEIFKDLFQNKSLSDKFIIEEFSIEHLEYPHILKMAHENGLLQFYEDLKNTNPTARKNALTELFNEGSKSSYYLILEHWSKETDNELKEFILEKIIE